MLVWNNRSDRNGDPLGDPHNLYFGLALLVFPYYLNKAVLNKTEILDLSGRAVGRLNCTFNIGHSIGHVIIWGILIILTLGLAGFLYVYRVMRVV